MPRQWRSNHPSQDPGGQLRAEAGCARRPEGLRYPRSDQERGREGWNHNSARHHKGLEQAKVKPSYASASLTYCLNSTSASNHTSCFDDPGPSAYLPSYVPNASSSSVLLSCLLICISIAILYSTAPLLPFFFEGGLLTLPVHGSRLFNTIFHTWLTIAAPSAL